ncbi:MAG: TetR/AcrR family transcriptional regulator [Solirubrobacteraceae bacterium]
MIELLPVKGYLATTTRAMCARARVSQKTYYLQFGNKEGYFLATYWTIVRQAVDRVNAAYRAKSEWTEQIQAGFDVFIDEVVSQPGAARLALVEALGAGPKALEAMTTAHTDFERILGSTFANSPEPVELPPIVLKAIAGGVARVVRQRLLDGRAPDLRGEAPELLRWMLAYHSNAARMLPPVPPPSTTRPTRREPKPGAADDRERMMEAATLLAVRYGFANVSAAKIIQQAGVSDPIFFDRFPSGVEECFMAAYNQMGDEVAAYVAEAAVTETYWPRAVRAAMAALLWRIASDEVFAQVAFVQVFSAGPATVAGRSRLMASFSDLLLSHSPPNQRPSVLVAEAIVGAIWQIVHHYVVRGAARQLPILTDLATYIVLVPALGGEAAMTEIHAAHKASATHVEQPRDLSATTPTDATAAVD